MKTIKILQSTYFLLVLPLILLQSCYTDKKITVDAVNHVMDDEYWNSGKAEISRYELTQKRYSTT
ncbi:MAG: hypothetical protein NWP83_08390, partial [Spirosomaceae bacterium]|nr:hypothetical protein [Spirosomataceae bacterium]